VVVEVVGRVDGHVVARFRGCEDRSPALLRDIGCIVGVVEVSVAEEEVFRIQINEILNHEWSAARLHLQASHIGVEQHDVAFHRRCERGVGQPGENHAIFAYGAASRIHVLNTEDLLPGGDDGSGGVCFRKQCDPAHTMSSSQGALWGPRLRGLQIIAISTFVACCTGRSTIGAMEKVLQPGSLHSPNRRKRTRSLARRSPPF
jgi:hypothetical protein